MGTLCGLYPQGLEQPEGAGLGQQAPCSCSSGAPGNLVCCPWTLTAKEPCFPTLEMPGVPSAKHCFPLVFSVNQSFSLGLMPQTPPAAQVRPQPSRGDSEDLVNLDTNAETGRGKDEQLCHFPGETGPAQRPIVFRPKVAAVLCTVTWNCPGLQSPGPLMQKAGRATPSLRVLGAGQMVPLSQRLLELEQTCPALDDLPHHKAGRRRPQLIVGSWQRHKSTCQGVEVEVGNAGRGLWG